MGKEFLNLAKIETSERDNIRYLALIELSETLGKQLHPVWEKVEFILNFCPQLSGDYQPKEKELDQYNEDEPGPDADIVSDEFTLTDEHQEATIALCKFLVHSEGKYLDKCLPTILKIAKNLAHCKWSKKCKLSPDFFCYHLVFTLRQLSETLRKKKDDKSVETVKAISVALIDGLLVSMQKIIEKDLKYLAESKRFLKVLLGVFSALGQGLPDCSPEQVSFLFSFSSSFLDTMENQLKQKILKTKVKSIMILTLNILIQMTYLKGVDLSDYMPKFWKIGSHFCSPGYTKHTDRDTIGKLFSAAVGLAARSSGRLKHSQKEILKHLAGLLSEGAVLTALTPSTEEMIVSIIHGIATLYHEELSSVNDALKVFLEFLENNMSSKHIITETTTVICSLLKDSNDSYVTSQFVTQLASITYNLSLEDALNNTIFGVLVKIAQLVNQPAITSQVYHILFSHFSKLKSSLEINTNVDAKKKTEDIAPLVSHFAEISPIVAFEDFKTVLDTIFGVYKNPTDPQEAGSNLGAVISNFVLRCAVINDKQRQNILLTKTMSLFNKISEKIRAILDGDDFKNGKNKFTEKELVSHVEVLLTPISLLEKSVCVKIDEPDEKMQQSFRRMWFYIVLFSFFDSQLLEVREACSVIAKFGPALHGLKASSFLETDNEYDGLTKNVRIQALNKLNNSLIEILPEQKSTLIKLPVTKTALLLSIYTLESQRIKTGVFRYCLSYLEDQSLFTVEDIYNYLVLITRNVFEKWMIHIDSLEQTAQLPILEHQIIFLFKGLCRRILTIRKLCDDFIKAIIKRFPFIYYSFICLTMLLDLQNAISNGAAIGITTKLVKISLPENNEEIILPEYVSDRQKILENFSSLTLDWLTNALAFAPNVVRVALEEYLFHFRNSYEGTIGHVGYSLALALCNKDEKKEVTGPSTILTRDKLKGLSVLNENRFYLISQAVSVKSFHSGEISSLREFSKLGAKELKAMFRDTLIETLNEYKKKNTLNTKRYNHYLQLATAFLVTEKDLSSHSLIQWLVWIPIYIFTEESLKTATFCWKWLSAARPELDQVLLNEIYVAWIWTRDNKMGLYSSSEYESVELAVNVENTINTKADSAPHRWVIEFLSEMFQRMRSTGGREIFLKILIHSLKGYQTMNKTRASMGTRFRLCYLGSHVAIRMASLNDDKLNVYTDELKSLSYETALNWFTITPSWPDPETPARIVQEDVSVLAEFAKRLRLECEALVKHSRQISNLPGTEVSTRNIQIEKKMKGLKYVDLLEKLVYNEIERIKLWFNPQKPNQYITFPPPTIPISIKDIPRNTWLKFLNEAWNFSPRLALNLDKHFRFIDIRSELQDLIRINAIRLIDIPEAVDYLITEKNVNQNIVEFRHLLNWTPCSLSFSLKYLNQPFCANSLVVQYAIRGLRKFEPEVVTFYLPQLVQNLRHDKSCLLKNFMLETVKKNNTFAHQLIWALRTELIDKKDLNEKEISELSMADYEIAEIAEGLIESALKAFSNEQKKVYDEEFGFFDSVTRISGELRNIPKVDEDGRRKELVKQAGELKKVVESRPNLYLPTSAEHKITTLDPNKSFPLKSAKKVPILLTFKTKRIDHHGKVYPETDVKCIFKQGDDCRQDSLALQIIAMFKRMFQRAKLPLYLYPYRVIPTGRGMGVIECVPDTKSRHEVGAESDGSLYDYFKKKYGQPDTVEFQNARRNFIESMAAYSVVSYILNIKDRHNGNILMDEQGHIVHIDFGFLFDTQPGGKFGLEQFVSFKLTREMLLIMGEDIKKKSEVHSDCFNLFKDLVIRAYLVSRDFQDEIYPVVETMRQSQLPCFKPAVMTNLKTRFSSDKSDQDATDFIIDRVGSSYDNTFSILYDKFQEIFEGVRAWHE